jgi:hypothetical protein
MSLARAKSVEALIVALPETAGSALYGMVDVLAATGTLWQELVGEEPGTQLIRPRIMSVSRAPLARQVNCSLEIGLQRHGRETA